MILEASFMAVNLTDIKGLKGRKKPHSGTSKHQWRRIVQEEKNKVGVTQDHGVVTDIT